MQTEDIQALLQSQRSFFNSGATLSKEFRVGALKSLLAELQRSRDELLQALNDDLGKSAGEAWLTEAGMLLSELKRAIKELPAWMKPRRAASPLFTLPAKSRIYPEPLGLMLSISPWNYPLQLALMPVVAGVAAGNCLVLKPSSKAPRTSESIAALVRRAFAQEHVTVAQGGAETAGKLLEQRFDFIMYTGSARVGRTVMAAAARYLTPVCLELGGKSPAIVCGDADLKLAAKRIAWGKSLNAGQTCIAPDYVLAQSSIKDQLAELLQKELNALTGPNPLHNPRYCRIISTDALERLSSLARLSGAEAAFDIQTRRMAPLVLDSAKPDDPAMQVEIFGPLLPVLPFDQAEQAIDFVREREKPLACYIFAKSGKTAGKMLREISFGGGCVNDAMLHFSVPGLPFGGVGQSGMGRYHGRYGFDMMSNLKGVTHKLTGLDPSLRYPPYTERKLKLLRFFLG